jgi:hydroxylaminobenzene mutase
MQGSVRAIFGQEEGMSIEDPKRRLIWHGMFLFLLGLVTGFVEPQFRNVRMALAAHLEGVMNGIFIIALGAIWNELKFSARQNVVAYWTALYGTYANWAVTAGAAVFGTAALSPITSAGQHGQPWQENIITAAFMSVGVAIITCAVLVLWGARRSIPATRL